MKNKPLQFSLRSLAIAGLVAPAILGYGGKCAKEKIDAYVAKSRAAAAAKLVPAQPAPYEMLDVPGAFEVDRNNKIMSAIGSDSDEDDERKHPLVGAKIGDVVRPKPAFHSGPSGPQSFSRGTAQEVIDFPSSSWQSGKFPPDRSMNRGKIAELLHRFRLEDNKFPDVPPGAFGAGEPEPTTEEPIDEWIKQKRKEIGFTEEMEKARIR